MISTLANSLKGIRGAVGRVRGIGRLCTECGAPAARQESVFCVACGGRLPIPGTSRWADRRVWAVAVSVAVLLAGIAAIRVPMSLASDPEEPVRELSEALETGDVELILELLEFDVDEAEGFGRVWSETPYELLGPQALSEGWEAPEFVLGETNRLVRDVGEEWWEADGRTLAMTRVGLGGDWERRINTYRTEAGWLRDWALDPISAQRAVLGRLELPHDPIGPLTVAGVAFEVPHEVSLNPSTAADVVIGTYTATHEHPMFEVEAETVVVRPGNTTALTFPVGPIRDEVIEAATEQIHNHLESCAEEATGLRPVGCVLQHDPGHFIPLRGEAEWEIESMPEVSFEPTDTVHERGRFTITVTTTRPGKARVTYAVLDEEPRTVDIEIEVGGNVELTEGGNPQWQP